MAGNSGSPTGIGPRVLAVRIAAAMLMAITGAALLGTQVGAGQQRPQANAPELETFNSRFYEIHSDMPRRHVAAFAEHMDRVYREYSNRFRSFRTRDRREMPLYLFSDQEAYMRYLAQYRIPAVNSAGMFVSRGPAEGLHAWVGNRPEAAINRTLQHEGFHQFAFRHIGPQLPIWANEGIAQYFDDGLMVNNRMVVGVVNGSRLASVKNAIENETYIPFDEMLEMSNADWGRALQQDINRARIMYHQAWSMVYFLVHGDNGRYQRPFENYLVAISEGTNPQRAFEDAFRTDDPRAFENRWRRVVTQLEPDPLHQTVERLEFIGTAIQFLHNEGRDIPDNMADLQQKLERGGYVSWRVHDGIRQSYRASDDELFQIPARRGEPRPFQMLDPARDNLPPRVTAPGIRPQPLLIWRENPRTEKLEFVIQYR